VEDFKLNLINYFDGKLQPSSNIGSSKITPVSKKQRRVNPKICTQIFLKEHLKEPISVDLLISNLMEILDQEAFSSMLIFTLQNPKSIYKRWRQFSSLNKLSIVQLVL
jgi:hypothetical protein